WRAGVAGLKGAGELTGSHGIREWGQVDTPVDLTATMAVGRVFDGAVSVAVASDPQVGVDDVLIPAVGECDDSDLSEARVVQVEAADAVRAVGGATGWPFDAGAVRAGTGVARRAGPGLARTGSVAHHGSGEIFVAFSTSSGREVEGWDLDPLFAATVDATEEAVLNAIWAAPDVEGRDGLVVRGLPHDDVLE